MAVIMHFLRNRVIITGSSSSESRCEEDGLSSSVAFLSTWNESVLWDEFGTERTAPLKNIFHPIVKNQNVLHQLRVNCCSTRVSLNCSDVNQGILGILAVLEPRLDASLMNKSKPMFL